MYSSFFINFSSPSTGILDFSQVLNVAVNSRLCLLPNIDNPIVKYISANVVTNLGDNFLDFWDIRIQGLNRDGSLITQNAGIIQNPISGDWGSAFVKDTILDFVLSSKKSIIYFEQGIKLGGVRPQTISFKFKNPLPINRIIFWQIEIQYEQAPTNSNL